MPERAQRRRALTARFRDLEIDGLLVSFLPNVRYLTGFTGSNAILALTPESALMYTDLRYQTQSKQQVDCKSQAMKGSIWHAAAGWAKRKKLKRIGVEAARVTLEQQADLAKNCLLYTSPSPRDS